MNLLQKLVCGTDKLFSSAVSIILIFLLLYSGYALWDNLQIYGKASVSEEIMHYKPQKPDMTDAVTSEGSSNPSLSDLQKLNPDLSAWLTIDRTNIDYPVMQSDDNIKYLNLDVNGKYSLAGSIFLDCGCDGNYDDMYSLLYGHNMDGGAMFGDILKYDDEKYFTEHQTGSLYTPDATYELTVFAYLHVDAYASPMFIVGIGNTEYRSRLDYIKENAKYYNDIGVTAEDRIIAMSTCSDATTNGRSIIVALLTEK